jgi:hypothetical protein
LDNLLVSKLILPGGGGMPAILLSSATIPKACGKHSAEADQHSAS